MASSLAESLQLIDERGIVGRKPSVYLSWSSTLESCFFQVADSRCMEIDIVQNQASLCPEFERLDDANGECCRRFWQSEIRRCRFGSHCQFVQ